MTPVEVFLSSEQVALALAEYVTNHRLAADRMRGVSVDVDVTVNQDYSVKLVFTETKKVKEG